MLLDEFLNKHVSRSKGTRLSFFRTLIACYLNNFERFPLFSEDEIINSPEIFIFTMKHIILCNHPDILKILEEYIVYFETKVDEETGEETRSKISLFSPHRIATIFAPFMVLKGFESGDIYTFDERGVMTKEESAIKWMLHKITEQIEIPSIYNKDVLIPSNQFSVEDIKFRDDLLLTSREPSIVQGLFLFKNVCVKIPQNEFTSMVDPRLCATNPTLPYEYQRNEDDLEFLRNTFLRYFPTPSKLKIFQQSMASLALGELGPKEKKCLVLIGGSNGGKSSIKDLIEKTFSNYCCPISAPYICSRAKPNSISSETMQMKDKLIIFINELRSQDVINEATFKNLIGPGNEQTGRDLYKPQSKFLLNGTVVITSNEFPVFNRNSNAMNERLLVLTFESRFYKQPPKEGLGLGECIADKNEYERFKNSYQAFFCYVMEDCMETLKQNPVLISESLHEDDEADNDNDIPDKEEEDNEGSTLKTKLILRELKKLTRKVPGSQISLKLLISKIKDNLRNDDKYCAVVRDIGNREIKDTIDAKYIVCFDKDYKGYVVKNCEYI